jgi:hypothetical protein
VTSIAKKSARESLYVSTGVLLVLVIVKAIASAVASLLLVW